MTRSLVVPGAALLFGFLFLPGCDGGSVQAPGVEGPRPAPPPVSGSPVSAPCAGRKVLLVDSYHPDLAWSASIIRGVKQALEGTGVRLSIVSMDTKRHGEESFKQQAAAKVRDRIEADPPDVVIAADDNASKYLVSRYYKGARLPFVFCGVNWDATGYGYPYQNATGMVEVALTRSLLNQMRKYAKGDRVGFLGPDVLTRRKDVAHIQKVFGIRFARTAFVVDFQGWKEQFQRLQSEVDMLLLGQIGGVKQWDERAARAFVLAHCRIPTGADEESMTPYALIGLTKVGEEQGQWAANTAIRILQGTPPAQIPVARNHRGNLFVNLPLADRLGVTFDLATLSKARQLRAAPPD